MKERLITTVVHGINYFQRFFGFEFPWEKYDHFFCPEHQLVAMENVGAVSLDERFLYVGQTLGEPEITSFNYVLLHELCHSWFGNVATMTWWDDLWLNESFASVMGYLAIAEIPELFSESPNVWVDVNNYKNWGFETDDLPTSHPIMKYVSNTDSADSLFDGITYGKGCSFLKQLIRLMGIQGFSKATKKYFKRYAWKNTTLQDFLNCLGKDQELNMQTWCTHFLST
jgi:aminopeptidase N